ncbi:aminotransferase class I/II-fold pyridoxal phosphate-dependent enzyme [Novosphingobium aquimarinum]|uniref:aminotransferase class I/II-fold pyridoxal phosphate-dependent enzyme n=1 Tax=Novosphingobium aquimarinum TaxID=2682494 RepID=UPI0012EB0E64|nr:aminotransferase class I/II-fold pyridoxal phosphate-dependent enzyme [Novosphingobium aquimarinum]
MAFVSGHATNLAVIDTVMGQRDLVLYDELAHNSIFVGAQMSGAQRMAFAHNDPDSLERLLVQHRARYRHCLIVSEGLFSMDGDGPDLARLVEIKARHRAWLMIDEAHSLGVLGRTGRGIFEEQGVDPQEVDIWMGTLSKTLVSCGGYVAGPAALIEFLKFQAPGMVYSVGLPPTAAVAATEALDLMLAEPERVARLRANGQRFIGAVRAAGFDPGSSWGLAVAPVFIGDSLQTVLLSERMMERGFATVPVFAPGVPEGQARIRFFLSASHCDAHIDAVVATMAEEQRAVAQSGLSVSRVATDAIRARSQDSDG